MEVIDKNLERADIRYNMIIIKGEIKTSKIMSCEYDENAEKWNIKFNNGKIYQYGYSNVKKLTEPKSLNPNLYHIKIKGEERSDIKAIYEFKSEYDSYWHICFCNGSEEDYYQSELNIVESILNNDVFRYIKRIASLNCIKNEDGESILEKKFEKLSSIRNDIVLTKYLNPSLLSTEKTNCEYIPIFPFGCNNSQYKAVKSAMENQISVIHGPPGTGKTQTILNIIANILMEGKTVQIVSNNNSAIENVYEKLSSYELNFIVANLGNREKKKDFIKNQENEAKSYPDFSSWIMKESSDLLYKRILEQSNNLKNIFGYQEELACLKQELSQLVLELKYFNNYIKELDIDIKNVKFNKKLYSKSWMKLWRQYQFILENKKSIGFLFKIKSFFKYGITDRKFYKQDITKIITIFQAMYYDTKNMELSEHITNIEKKLKDFNKDLLEDLQTQSMTLLKDKLAREYVISNNCKIFNEGSLWKKSQEVLKRYPVILSTTFSSRDSLNSDVVYDYIIVDEASQVDIATGALALSCARNAVIVGDTKQLPNVVTNDMETKAKVIFDRYNVNEGYLYTKSLLQSVLEVMPKVTQTLLREHYRCHPKIINFCNQKFYCGDLIVMTTDNGEEDVLSVVKTVKGNHERNHSSQRQIDVIKTEILPKCDSNFAEIGIIAPYKNHVEALKREIKDIDIATVHKFQGKEKNNIIISTVDDEISDFVDDPHLINVAVSRAKKKLAIVTTGNEQSKERNIKDLIDYIEYNNFEVVDSKIYSVFDYLYKEYTKERMEYLKHYKKVSKYDSENLMYSLINKIIVDKKYSSLDVICHIPLRALIKNMELLNEKERKYVMNPATHLDFLIYNRTSKKPVLAIEVDGYFYHKEGTVQASRDLLKNHILELYKIYLLRFLTNGSNEREKIIEMLDKVIS